MMQQIHQSCSAGSFRQNAAQGFSWLLLTPVFYRAPHGSSASLHLLAVVRMRKSAPGAVPSKLVTTPIALLYTPFDSTRNVCSPSIPLPFPPSADSSMQKASILSLCHPHKGLNLSEAFKESSVLETRNAFYNTRSWPCILVLEQQWRGGAVKGALLELILITLVFAVNLSLRDLVPFVDCRTAN